MAVVVESSLSHVNGVTGSVRQVVRHLVSRQDEVLLIAPHSPSRPPDLRGVPFVGVASMPLPGYPEVRVALATVSGLRAALARFRPDVVHLASPALLGWRALLAAESLGVPTVAIYQTDLIQYAARYRLAATRELLVRAVARLHHRSTLTLAPSRASAAHLEHDLGVPGVRLWARGVDTALFRPDRRDERWRRRVSAQPVIVGYAGRLAPEKQLEDLAVLGDIPGIRLVLVGDGPSRAQLEPKLPDAAFLGHLNGRALAAAVASFDVFVHPGEAETFGQAIQEALASGVPVVAPGVGGPVDLVESSRTGWLYRPGDLADLRARVVDLVGDAGKRRAFGAAAVASVRGRSWTTVCEALRLHYEHAIAHNAAGSAAAPVARAPRRSASARTRRAVR